MAGWVQNAFDEEYKTDSFDLSTGFNLVLDVIGDPRTYGVTTTILF